MRRLRPPPLQCPAEISLAEPSIELPNIVRWERFLAQLTAEICILREAAADEAALLAVLNHAWSVPEGLGTIPEHLAPRAVMLLDEMSALEVKLTQRREEIARQIRAVESVPRVSGVTSIYLDSIG